MKTPATTIRRFILSGIFLLMLLPFSILAQDKVKILYVSDGDTFHALTERGEKLKIRLSDVDCPESSQTFGLEAKEFSLTAILGKEVIIKISDTDRYGRKIARVVYDDKDLSEELVRNGFAWHYKKYSKDELLAKLEVEARAGRVGLWKHNSPVAPWEFRKSKR